MASSILVILQPLFNSSILVSVFLVIFAICLLYYHKRNLPPGPMSMPLTGYLPFFSVPKSHTTLSETAKKYGNVMRVSAFGETMVHLNGYKAIADAFASMKEAYAGRPTSFSFFTWVTDRKGIGQSEGPVWKEHRRFAMHALRDFGYGKRSLEVRVQEIANDFATALKETETNPQDPFTLTSNCVANVICSIVFSHRYALNDPEFLELRTLVDRMMEQNPGVEFFLPFPWFTLKLSGRYKEMVQVKEGIHAMLRKHVQHHEDTFDSSNLRDYIDVYLEERRRAAEEGTLEKSSFTIHRLICICFNFFLAGTDTVSRTLHWAMKLLSVHKDIQERIQKEVDEVFGKDFAPSYMERSKLPYTEATIEEVLRYSSVVPISPFHSTLAETTLQGYTIPKRTSVIANLWSAHRDTKYWPDPETFDPSRFLNPDGEFTKRDGLVAFSIGKRVCPGESLARMELFIFLATTLQRFNLRLAEGENQDFDSTAHLIRKLNPYRLCAVPR